MVITAHLQDQILDERTRHGRLAGDHMQRRVNAMAVRNHAQSWSDATVQIFIAP